MVIDYSDIGKRIRKERVRQGISQAKLAEISGLSTTNMSHIECANTKLSLPTLLSVANALGITPDQILCGTVRAIPQMLRNDFAELFADCGPGELKALYAICEAGKAAIRTHIRKEDT